MRRVQIPEDVAEDMAQALRDSQDDKERFHRAAVMRLQQRYLGIQLKLDRPTRTGWPVRYPRIRGCGVG